MWYTFCQSQEKGYKIFRRDIEMLVFTDLGEGQACQNHAYLIYGCPLGVFSIPLEVYSYAKRILTTYFRGKTFPLF